MGRVSRENGVLKLVHPGGFVETYNVPVTAAEVMRMNPRHFVTRPDVFKFPWIVVRPESVLYPGRVFFIVPYHTIHRLLQKSNGSKRIHHNLSPKRGLSEETQFYEDVLAYSRQGRLQKEEDFQINSFHRLVKKEFCSQTGHKVVNFEIKENGKKGDLNSKYSAEMVQKNNKPYFDKSLEMEALGKFDFLESQLKTKKKQYPVEIWPKKMIFGSEDHYQQEFKQHISGLAPLQGNERGQEVLKHSQKATKLQPCLKKNGSNFSISRGLRVTFAIPIDDG